MTRTTSSTRPSTYGRARGSGARLVSRKTAWWRWRSRGKATRPITTSTPTSDRRKAKRCPRPTPASRSSSLVNGELAGVDVLELRVLFVLGRQRRSLDRPRNAEIGIVPADAAFGLGSVDVGALVHEERVLAGHAKTV